MDLYCKVFIDAGCEHEELVQRLAGLIGGTTDGRWISTAWGNFHVVRNVAFDDDRRDAEQDGFLYFRYFLDIEPSAEVDQNGYITQIGTLLASLWHSGIPAVAACDFEDKLPSKGGYNPKRGAQTGKV
jgi:hypothetical protein